MTKTDLTLDASPAKPSYGMPAWSRYAGQAMDCSSRHSIALVGDCVQGNIASGASHAAVDYFYHEGQYWRAVIPLDGVDQVFGQAFNFSRIRTRKTKDGPIPMTDARGVPKRVIPILNHLQTRFTFKPDQPIRLLPMANLHADHVEPQTVSDIVYTIEATGPPGVTFNLRDAMGGNLLCAHRFVSTQEMVFERIAVENQFLQQSPPLLLQPGEERALLVKSLERSHRAGMDEPYYLYRVCGANNCTSNPFQILDQVVNYTWPQWLGSLLYRLPLHPRFYLWVRGLDSAPGERTLVRDAFEAYLSNPETRRRKREYVRSEIALRRAARDARDE